LRNQKELKLKKHEEAKKLSNFAFDKNFLKKMLIYFSEFVKIRTNTSLSISLSLQEVYKDRAPLLPCQQRIVRVCVQRVHNWGTDVAALSELGEEKGHCNNVGITHCRRRRRRRRRR
jgi:hypothetical protein